MSTVQTSSTSNKVEQLPHKYVNEQKYKHWTQVILVTFYVKQFME